MWSFPLKPTNMPHIKAPFTPEQVLKLKAWQDGTTRWTFDLGGTLHSMPCHPFTCCSHNGCERGDRPDEGILIPSTEGWTCPCGAWKQDWCHDYMINNQKEDNEQQPTTIKE